jgi:hypothetical protein
MRKFTMLLLLLACFALPAMSRAQDEGKPAEPAKTAEPAHYYRVTFTVQEVDAAGKPTNSRSYTTILSTRVRQVSIRTGSRIPIAVGTASNPNWQYQNLGVNIDVQEVQEVGRALALTINADITGLTKSPDDNLREPTVRTNRWDSPVLVPIGKATVVFTSDDLDSKGSLQMVVTATPMQ